jgi:hypothetical protein
MMAGLAGLLVLVSFVSWYRLRSLKLALVGCAFLTFLIKAALLLLNILPQDIRSVVIDFIILVLLYFAIIKK